MKLTEFDLDAPDAEQKERSTFRRETRCMGALYARCFPGLKVDGGWKVLVECVSQVQRAEIRNLLGVFTIQVPFSLEAYWGVAPAARKEAAVDALHRGACRVAEMKGWPLSPFEVSRAGAAERGYVNEWTWPTAKASPNRRHLAFLICRHEPDEFAAFLVIETKDGTEVQRQRVIAEPPSEFLFVPKMGKLSWASDSRVVLTDKNGREVGEASTP